MTNFWLNLTGNFSASPKHAKRWSSTFFRRGIPPPAPAQAHLAFGSAAGRGMRRTGQPPAQQALPNQHSTPAQLQRCRSLPLLTRPKALRQLVLTCSVSHTAVRLSISDLNIAPGREESGSGDCGEGQTQEAASCEEASPTPCL